MRSRTRSDVKWLVNQAAALAGELTRLDEEATQIARRRAVVENAHQACLRTLSVAAGSALSLSLPEVRAHRPYGGRGNLRQFLRDVLKNAVPAELDSNELALMVIDRFSLTFASQDEFYRFKNNTIGRALRRLEQEGTVEPAVGQYAGPPAFGAWRWKAELPSLDELAEQTGGGVVGTEG